jgi:hypothetical protein
MARSRLVRSGRRRRRHLFPPEEISRQIEALRNGEPIPETPALRHNVDLVAQNQERLLRGEAMNEIQALHSGRLPKSEAGS